MKKVVGFIGLAFLHLMVACSSMAPTETRKWQPTAVTDFKSVAGKWEGFLTSDDPRALHFDRATLVIDDTGACESAITRTITKAQGTSVSYDVIDVFAEQGKLVLTDDKLSTKFQKGGQMTATRLAFEHPERVKNMILTGGEPRIETEESRAIARELGRTARMDFVRQMLTTSPVAFEDMKKGTADFFYDPYHPRIDEVAEMRLAIIRRPGVQEKEREAAFRQVERGRSNYASSDLARITAPTYLIHGRDERFFYPKEIALVLLECATRVGFSLPDCSCILLSHCGHWPQIERAETFNKLSIEFLRESAKSDER